MPFVKTHVLDFATSFGPRFAVGEMNTGQIRFAFCPFTFSTQKSVLETKTELERGEDATKVPLPECHKSFLCRSIIDCREFTGRIAAVNSVEIRARDSGHPTAEGP